MDFTWFKREAGIQKIPVPNPRTHVNLIVRPLKLPHYTLYVVSQVDVKWLPFLVAKYYMRKLDRFVYCHRRVTDIGEVKRLNPPQ